MLIGKDSKIMNQKNDKNPHLDSSTVQQWVRQSAQLKPTEPIPERKKTEEDIRNNRMEWMDLAATAFCLALPVLLIILNVLHKSDSTLLRITALLLPLLTLLLYYTGILNQNTHSGDQGIAIPLFLSSIASLFTGINTGYIAFLNYFQFILPCILSAAFFLVINSVLKRKRNRYLALLIMIIWLPFYIPAFVTLLNVIPPSLHTEAASSELRGTDYHGDDVYTVRVKVDEIGKTLEFGLTKDIYDRVSYDSTAEVTIHKGLLGIDYAKVRLDNLE